MEPSKSSFELNHATARAQDAPVVARKHLPVVEAALALGAAEALVVPLAAEGLDVLADDALLAAPALGGAALRALRLALDAPRVAVLFNVRHAVLKGVAALGAEKVSVVPVGAERDNVLAEDRRLAVLAARRKLLVPVEVAVEAQALVAVLLLRLAGHLLDDLAALSALDAVQSRVSRHLGLGADLHGFQGNVAREAREALWVEALGDAGQGHRSPFNGE